MMLQLHFEIGFVRHFNYCYTLKRKEIDTTEKNIFVFLNSSLLLGSLIPIPSNGVDLIQSIILEYLGVSNHSSIIFFTSESTTKVDCQETA